MNISSYNITEVGYHYIGLRVLDGMGASAQRSQQLEAISSNVRKFVGDRALRLMLPEPRGTFLTVGQKVCEELVHFEFAFSEHGGPYELTTKGRDVLGLLKEQRYLELRKVMASVHLRTYANLRAIVQAHLDGGAIWQPVVSSVHLDQPGYLQGLLDPTFERNASTTLAKALDQNALPTPKKIEDALRAKVITHAMPAQRMGVALFRAICDRLVSLRLLNRARTARHKCEFEKTYSPCVVQHPMKPWHSPLQVLLDNGESYRIFISEPAATDPNYQDALLSAIDQALSEMSPIGGYYDIPDLRDTVCEYLMIPEAAFDDGLNCLLDRQPAVLSVGLQYDKITARRRPLVRNRQNTQLHNLIRRV